MKSIQNENPQESVNAGSLSDIKEFRTSENDLKAILNMSPAGIGRVIDQKISWTNSVFLTMFGYDELDSLYGMETQTFFIDELEYKRVMEILFSGIKKLGTGVVETRLKRKDNKILNCRIRASRLDESNPSRGEIFVITDISEIKLLQLQLQQAQKMEAIGVLAGGVSHDFNNILMGIQGHISLMKIDVTQAEKVKTHLTHIGRLVNTAAELTGRLLGFARGGKYIIKTVDMNDLISMSLSMFKTTRKELVVNESYEKDLHCVEADRSQLEQVVFNLYINASQAMDENPVLNIKSENIIIEKNHHYPFEVAPGNYIKVSIQDNGTGMDEATQKKIFDPFFSTKEFDHQKGTGLGLSTVFGIIKNHKGFILVDSEKGKGSTFHIFLPASTKTKDNKQASTATNGLGPLLKGSETIMIVDNDEDVVNIGKNFLAKLGYTTLIAKNSLDAIEIFTKQKDEINLVIIDLSVSEMNGEETFLKIKEINKDAKILISSVHAMNPNIEGFLNQGCHGLIQKPFGLKELSFELRAILDK